MFLLSWIRRRWHGSQPCLSWTKLSVFPYWKEKIKTPSWVCSAPSSSPETIKMLSRSQQQADGCQMKMSTGCSLFMLAAGLAEAAPGQTSQPCPVRSSFKGCCGSKVNPALSENKGVIAVFGWWIQNAYCRLYQLPQLFNWNFESRKKMVSVPPCPPSTLSGQNLTYLDGFILKYHF